MGNIGKHSQRVVTLDETASPHPVEVTSPTKTPLDQGSGLSICQGAYSKIGHQYLSYDMEDLSGPGEPPVLTRLCLGRLDQ